MRVRAARLGGTPLVSPPRFKPTRDRAIKVREVPCPSCDAGVGEFCHKLDGSPGPVQHPIRRRMAIRAMNEASE